MKNIRPIMKPVRELYNRVQSGDAAAAPELRATIDSALAAIYQRGGQAIRNKKGWQIYTFLISQKRVLGA